MTTQTICMGKDKKREIMKTMIQVRLESSNNPKLHSLQVWPIIYWSLSIYKIISHLRNKKDLHLILLVINKELKKLLVMPRLKNGSSVEKDAILKNSALTDEFQISHSLNQTQWCTSLQPCLTRYWQLLGHHWKVFCYQFMRVLANQMVLSSHGLSHYFKFICLQSSRIIRTARHILYNI